MKQMSKLTILGSGTLDITKDQNPSGLLLEVEETKILVDCGFGILRRLMEASVDLQTIDAICISHFHTDHFADCFALIHSRFVHDLYEKSKHKPVVIIGPKGIKERYKKWREIFWPEPGEQYPVEIQENGDIKLGKVQIRSFPVKHVPWFDSIAFDAEFAKKKIIYTGDIGMSTDLKKLSKHCQNATLLITEATYDKATQNHLSIDQVLGLVESAKVKRCLMVHTRPFQAERVKKVLSKHEKANLAYDRMEINL